MNIGRQGGSTIPLASKRVISILSVVFIVCLVLPQLALASRIGDTKRRLESGEARTGSLQSRMNRVATQHHRAWGAYTDTKFSIRKTQAKIQRTQRKMRARQKLLRQRSNYIYRYGEVDIAEVLLGANDFNDFVTRVDLLVRITDFDAALVREIRASRDRLRRDRAFLKKRLGRQQRNVAALSSSKRELDILFARQDAENKRLGRDLRSLVNQERLSRLRALQASYYARSYSSQPVRLIFKRGGYVFPVAGSHAFTSTFGAPRRGHTHQGNDIFGRRGTPLVAVTSGSIRRRAGGIGGLAVWLTGSDGNCYYYAHLDGFGSAGSVSAGTVVGYLGDSGNAQGTSPHLHFEIHPGCGRAVDPYGILRGWE